MEIERKSNKEELIETILGATMELGIAISAITVEGDAMKVLIAGVPTIELSIEDAWKQSIEDLSNLIQKHISAPLSTKANK